MSRSLAEALTDGSPDIGGVLIPCPSTRCSLCTPPRPTQELDTIIRTWRTLLLAAASILTQTRLIMPAPTLHQATEALAILTRTIRLRCHRQPTLTAASSASHHSAGSLSQAESVHTNSHHTSSEDHSCHHFSPSERPISGARLSMTHRQQAPASSMSSTRTVAVPGQEESTQHISTRLHQYLTHSAMAQDLASR